MMRNNNGFGFYEFWRQGQNPTTAKRSIGGNFEFLDKNF
jgi:hypothetical protein